MICTNKNQNPFENLLICSNKPMDFSKTLNNDPLCPLDSVFIFHCNCFTYLRLVRIVFHQPFTEPNLLRANVEYCCNQYLTRLTNNPGYPPTKSVLTHGLRGFSLQSSVSPRSRTGLTFLLRYSSVVSPSSFIAAKRT